MYLRDLSHERYSMNLSLLETTVVFDLETTGPDKENDRIVEINIKRFEEGVQVTSFEELVNPGIPIPAGASEVHGIKDQDVAEKPRLDHWIDTILELMRGAVLMGYNILNFDIPLLDNEIQRFDYTDLDSLLGGPQVVDVMSMYREIRPRTLEAAYRELVDENFVQTHRAEDDVRMTGEVFNAMSTLEAFSNSSLEDLDKLSRGDRIDWNGRFKLTDGRVVIGFGKHRGKSLRQAYKEDRSWFDWASGKISDFESAFRKACSVQRELETVDTGDERAHQ